MLRPLLRTGLGEVVVSIFSKHEEAEQFALLVRKSKRIRDPGADALLKDAQLQVSSSVIGSMFFVKLGSEGSEPLSEAH